MRVLIMVVMVCVMYGCGGGGSNQVNVTTEKTDTVSALLTKSNTVTAGPMPVKYTWATWAPSLAIAWNPCEGPVQKYTIYYDTIPFSKGDARHQVEVSTPAMLASDMTGTYWFAISYNDGPMTEPVIVQSVNSLQFVDWTNL